MKRSLVLLSSVTILFASNWVSFNIGTDYGIDLGVCVFLGVSNVDPEGNNQFCQSADDTTKTKLRDTWLYVIGNETGEKR